MGVTNTMYAYGLEYSNPAKPYDMKGFVNGPGAVKGLKVYKDLYDCCMPPGHSNAYMTEDLDAYKSGQVAMQMNFIAFFPGISKDPQVGGEKTGFFAIPRATSSSRSSAARASRWSSTPTRRTWRWST